MHQASQQLPIAYRGWRTAIGPLGVAQAPDGTWHVLDPQFDLRGNSGLALALAASRLPDLAAIAVYGRLRRALVDCLGIRWHLTATYLADLLADLRSPHSAADLDGCPLGDTP